MSRVLIVFLLGVIFSLIFSMQNNVDVTIYFGPWQITKPLPLILLISFSLGFFLSLIVVIPNMIKNRRIISQQAKKIQELEKEASSTTKDLTKEKDTL